MLKTSAPRVNFKFSKYPKISIKKVKKASEIRLNRPKYPKIDKIKLSEGLKPWYCQLGANYLIRNPKTPYNVSIPYYLTLIYNLKFCRWTISQILAPKGVEISQNGQNQALRGAKVMILPIVSRLFD